MGLNSYIIQDVNVPLFPRTSFFGGRGVDLSNATL